MAGRRGIIQHNEPPATWRRGTHQNAVASVRSTIGATSRLVKTVAERHYNRSIPRFGEAAPLTRRGVHGVTRSRRPRTK